ATAAYLTANRQAGGQGGAGSTASPGRGGAAAPGAGGAGLAAVSSRRGSDLPDLLDSSLCRMWGRCPYPGASSPGRRGERPVEPSGAAAGPGRVQGGPAGGGGAGPPRGSSAEGLPGPSRPGRPLVGGMAAAPVADGPTAGAGGPGTPRGEVPASA